VTHRLSITPILAVALCGVLFACGARGDSTQIQDLPVTGWEQQEPVHFFYTAIDSVYHYNIDIGGRVFFNYFPDRFSVVLQVTAPSGSYFRDTLSCPVPHVADQLWSDFRLPYYRHVRFTETGEWRFSLIQNMNAAIIQGVSSIGIYIEQDGKK